MIHNTLYEPGEKTHRNENFPVASYLISGKHRPVVLAFYRFARTADDIADHPHLSEKEKIARLDLFEDTLLGKTDAVEDALPLRDFISRLGLSPRHAQDLLIAFRQDASKTRYKDWDDLIGYCMYSAAPVGRFVLDVHGESQNTWPASDALCNTLQIINHLQDCKADYQRLNRVYIPEETFARFGAAPENLAQAKASPALLACIAALAAKTQQSLAPASLSAQIRNRRLKVEVLAIEHIAQKLLHILLLCDPLSERVHLTRLQFASIFIKAIVKGIT